MAGTVVTRKLIIGIISLEGTLLFGYFFVDLGMETLMAVAQHQDCGGRTRSRIGHGFISSPSRGFKGINCRTFYSDIGILPFLSNGIVSPASPVVTKQQSRSLYSEPPKPHRGTRRSSRIPISPRPTMKVASFTDELSNSELWAGPAYSNSPPPSSLPIPKFSLCQKHTVSFELSVPHCNYEVRPLAKSAPSSPNRESYSPASDFFFNTRSATQDLRRILHLDIADD